MSSQSGRNRKNSRQSPEGPLDLEALGKRLAAQGQKTSWRSLQELAGSSDFMEHLQKEFPRQAQTGQFLSRREFIKLSGAALALAGLSACVPQPFEQIVPYVNPPDGITPGADTYYATAMTIDGFGRGLLVKSTMGRPIKAEGNPAHPASLGATDPFGQAALLTLYDPDRAKTITRQGRISTWDSFQAIFSEAVDGLGANQGAGLRVLSGPVSSPTLISQMEALFAKFPQARWIQYAPVSRQNVYSGAELAFGRRLNPVYHFERAEIVASIDADFTTREPGSLRYSHDFMAKRRVLGDEKAMNRLYSLDTSLTNTGALADHRLGLHPAQVPAFMQALAQRLGVAVPGDWGQNPVPDQWLSALVEDLQANPGAGLVIAGEQQPPEIHALGFAINAALGNLDQTVSFTEPVEANPQNGGSLSDLVSDLNAGRVELLLVLDQNPVYDAPADLNYPAAYPQARMSVCLGLYDDETAALSDWHIPSAHFLEAWSDVRAYDGTVTITQPLIEPLYAGKSAHEILAIMLGQPGATSLDVVQGFWLGQAGPGGLLEATLQGIPGVVSGGVPSATLAATAAITATTATSPTPPGPNLEVNPQQEFQSLRATQQAGLESYGWVNRQAGVVHIPIERAMQLLAQRGLPVITSSPPVSQ